MNIHMHIVWKFLCAFILVFFFYSFSRFYISCDNGDKVALPFHLYCVITILEDCLSLSLKNKKGKKGG